MTSASAIPSKIIARVAAVRVDSAVQSLLQDCFKQFGIQVVAVDQDPVSLFSRQKFEACVLRLYEPEAAKVLAAARSSTSNRRMVIYGIARNTAEALQFSAYGINAVLDEPLDRQGVLRVVRSTYLLVVHELRRYVRIPVVTETSVETGTSRISGMVVEVSGGGMSLRCPTPLASNESMRVGFTLPGSKKILVRAFLCWKRPAEGLYGLRFDPTDDARVEVREWIDQYLEIM